MPSDLDEVFALSEADRKKINHLKQLWSPWKNPEAEEDKRIAKRPVIAQDDKQRAIRNLRLYNTNGDVMAILSLAYNDPVIKTICLSPELDDHWRKIIQQILPPSSNQNNGEDIMPYKDIPVFESLELCGLLRLYYLNIRAKKGVHYKHTKALLEKIFKCNRFHLIQLIVYIERHLLQSNKVTIEKGDIAYYQEIAAKIAKLYGTHGCYEAADLLFEVGAFFSGKFKDPNIKQGLYIEALSYIYLSNMLEEHYLLSKKTKSVINSGQALDTYQNNYELHIEDILNRFPTIDNVNDRENAYRKAKEKANQLLQTAALIQKALAAISLTTAEKPSYNTNRTLYA